MKNAIKILNDKINAYQLAIIEDPDNAERFMSLIDELKLAINILKK